MSRPSNPRGDTAGLTLGSHSRIDATAEKIVARLGNGNAHVNRAAA